MRESLGRIAKEGLVGGMIAYMSVVVVLGVVNVVSGRSFFHTAACLGSVLLHGAEACSRFAVAPAPVLAYNGVHLLGSIAVGMIASIQVFETERHVSLWYFFFTVLLAAAMYSIAFHGVFGVEVGGVLDWTTVVIGTMVWIGSITTYFWWLHRSLVRRIQEDVEAEA